MALAKRIAAFFQNSASSNMSKFKGEFGFPFGIVSSR
jgi:hypothetical protein